MTELSKLKQLGAAYGVELQWYDIWGHRHEVSEATLRALLTAMRVEADDDAQVQRALDEREMVIWREPLLPALVVRETALPARLLVRFPELLDAGQLAWRLMEENGEQHGAPFVFRTLPEAERGEVRGQQFVARHLTLDAKPGPGYHRLCLLRGQQVLAQTLLIVVPDACYQPEAVRKDGRTWGPSVQLYSVRSERNWGMGDFTDLRRLLELWAERGADVVGLNPLHALFPHNPEHASPYSPSSRLFLNSLYLDPEHIDDFGECEEARELVHSSEFQARLRTLRTAELVDYRAVAAAKMVVLELLYASFRRRHLASNSARSGEFRDFQARGGKALREHALFEALQEHFVREDPATWGWPVWPALYRDPGSDEVVRSAEAQRDRVEFFEWLQWQSDRQLAEVSQCALELRLGIGLYGDLAVSIDRGGAETWSNQDLYALGASIGAPPDDFSLTGQNWGLPPMIPARLAQAGFAPFIATLRANMRRTGALRVDHVMGLMRLFWISSGATPADGAYVRYPFEELLGILALESQRNHCMVIGEDLGTVPDEVRRALSELQALSCRVLYFERREAGEFTAPGEYPAQALVAATTHDLPTLAGFWEGRDLALRAELNLFPSDQVRERQMQERSRDRARLLSALEREGLLPAGISSDPASVPTMTPELARAVQTYLARTRCQVCMVQLEDILGQSDQVNLPGTSSRYPNWRRKLTLDLERWPQDERFIALCEAVRRARPAIATANAMRPPSK
jgi:(1->4)-alpha-D-glucan 1-alpha-D-glucosylmutase